MTSLKRLLQEPGLLIAPGVYDLISLKIAAQSGCQALYMTGYGTVASHLGLPDAGLASYRDMRDRVAMMAPMAAKEGLPFIADGDTGYGGLINVSHTIKGYETAGAQAIQLEDQTFPKKCGHTEGRDVIPTEEMVDKIHVAVESRESDDFLIIARTDARTTLGLDEAIHRMEKYSKAGADILFIESPETEEELKIIGNHFDKPLVANMVEGGRTPLLSKCVLEKLGFKIAIYPAIGFLSAGKALETAYHSLIEKGETPKDLPLYSFEKFNKLMGFEEVWDIEKRYAK